MNGIFGILPIADYTVRCSLPTDSSTVNPQVILCNKLGCLNAANGLKQVRVSRSCEGVPDHSHEISDRNFRELGQARQNCLGSEVAKTTLLR
jgi:hypothetical protein